jgi:hypothetical protein
MSQSTFLERQEKLKKVKDMFMDIDRNEDAFFDKTNPRYSQNAVDHMYTSLKRLKEQGANKLASPISAAERANYENIMRDLDKYTAKFEAIVSNELLTGGKRRNKRSYKKIRRCRKKTRRCRKKRTSRRK